MHRLLQRQLKRYVGSVDPIPEEWKRFVDAVNEAYHQADADRTLLERSLDLTSEELIERNQQLEQQMIAERARAGLMEEQGLALLDVIQSVALGDLDVEVKVPEGVDVLSDLAIGLEMMIDDLREILAELEEARAELEQHVAERTQRLEAALKEMQAVQRRYLQREWEGYATAAQASRGYLLSESTEGPTMDAWLPAMTEAVQQVGTVTESDGQEGQTLAVPISLYGGVIGALGFSREEAEGWSEGEIAAVEAIIEQVALTLENQRLFEETQIHAKEMAVLNEMGRTLTMMLGVEAVIEHLYQHASRLIDTTNFYVALYYPDQDEVDFPFYAEGDQIRRPGRRRSGKGMTEYVIQTREPLLIKENVAARLEELGIEMIGQEAQSWLGVPMMRGEQVIGVIAVQSYTTPRLYNEHHRDMLSAIANQAAIAIENARLFEQTQVALAETEALYEGSNRVVRATTMDDILQALIYSTILQRLDRVSIAFFNRPWEDEMPEEAMIVATWERSGEESRSPVGTRYPLAQFPAIEAVTRDEPAIFRDITTDERVYETLRALLLDRLGMRSLILWPFVVGRQWIGFLTAQATTTLEINEDQIRQIASLTDQAATVIQNIRLFEQTRAALAETEALYRASRAIGEATSIQEIVHSAAEVAASLGLSACSLTLTTTTDEEGVPIQGDIYSTLITGNELIPIAPIPDFPLSDRAPARRVLEEPEFVLIYTDVEDPQATIPGQVRETMRNMGMRGMVTVGLSVHGRPLGFLSFSSATPLTDFPKEHVRRVRTVADQVAVTVESRRLFEETQRHAVQLETAAEVSQAATSILDTSQLLTETVNLIRDRFDLYYVGIFLLDEAGEYAVLQAGTGEAGQQMLKQDYKLQVGSLSMIGWCTAHSQARIALDMGKEAVRFDNPLLPGTRSEMALPLISRGQVIGAMTIQSDQPAAFSKEDIAVLQTMANQLANAIENTRLFQETKISLDEITLLHQRYLQEAWDGFVQKEAVEKQTGYMYDQTGVSPASNIWRPEMGLAVQQGDTIALSDMADALQGTVEEVETILQASPAQSALAVPLKVRGQTIGALDFYETDQARDWSADDIAMVETVASQVALAIENARAYEELQRTTKQLREMDRLKTQFLANMSHELRTPLNSIIGFSRVILKGIDGPINEQQKADLTSIYKNGQHLLEMINAILDISKIEAGRMELLFEPVDMQQIISGVMSTAIALVKDKPIELKQEVAPDLPTIRADGTRVRQVVLNLISNAAKFTEKGQITLRAWADEEQITISVSDTGIGIAPEHQTFIFEEFRQVDGSSTRRTGGTGLGLAISRHFVEMHGGRMWVESELDVGSTFTFTLPITDSAPITGPELADLTIDPSRKLILAVEDDEGAIAIYKRYLEEQGYQVIGLNQGKQAVHWARELSPYAIILDVLLPDEEGWTVLEELKSSREAYQIPVIVCTNVSDEEARGLSLGAADYLVKPISEKALLQSLKCLEERQQI